MWKDHWLQRNSVRRWEGCVAASSLQTLGIQPVPITTRRENFKKWVKLCITNVTTTVPFKLQKTPELDQLGVEAEEGRYIISSVRYIHYVDLLGNTLWKYTDISNFLPVFLKHTLTGLSQCLCLPPPGLAFPSQFLCWFLTFPQA